MTLKQENRTHFAPIIIGLRGGPGSPALLLRDQEHFGLPEGVGAALLGLQLVRGHLDYRFSNVPPIT